ncbi:MAG: bifunctional serine/threonine protein kinase/MFS transporter [Phycisphaerae bacterium]|nr:bifunctional serine/threonine protein kinase/MFS transporter [Phycisphaerae bacterium]
MGIVTTFLFHEGDRPLEGYTIQRGVGRGGFGEVYYAVSDGGKEVALKYLRDNPSVELRGVSACLNLKSPHLVSIYDVRQSSVGEWFVVMEYVSGPSLRELLVESAGGLGVAKATYLVREIGRGLTYLHERGIVHRDLKPGNVFWDEGYVKIGDYGLSKHLTASQHSGQTVSVGTVHYMAPEIGSGNYDRTIDLYALGVMLYEMLVGRVPYAGSTVGEILMKHLTAEPEVSGLAEPFPTVLRRALAKDPRERYGTVEEMVGAIFSGGGLESTLATFEPASLSTVAGRVAHRARVPVAAGGLGSGSSNRGDPFPGPPPPLRIDREAIGSADRWVGKVHDTAGRFAHRVDETRAGRAMERWALHRPIGERLGTALLLAIGFSFGVGLIVHEDLPSVLQTVRVAGPIGAIVGAVLLGSWIAFERYRFRSEWMARFLIASLAALLLSPMPSPIEVTKRTRAAPRIEAPSARIDGPMGSIVAPKPPRVETVEVSGAGGKFMAPLLLLLVLGNWPKRYYNGRKGHVSLGSAFSAGLLALVTSGILDVEPALGMAAIAVAASLCVETVASLWPLAAGRAATPGSVREADFADRDAPPRHVSAGAGHAWPSDIPDDTGVPNRRAMTAVGVPPVPVVPSEPGRVEYSPVSRITWFLLGVPLLGFGIAAFAASGLLAQNDRQMANYLMGGASGCLFGLMALRRSALRVQRGVWRGFLQPLALTTGIAAITSSGIGMGLLAASESQQFQWLLGLMLGVSIMIFAIFLPVGAFVPTRPSPEELATRRRRTGGVILGGGIFLLVWSGSMVPLLQRHLDQELVPAVIGPLGIGSIGLIIWGGFILGRTRLRGPKLELPLRCTFLVPANVDLSAVVERHCLATGFRLKSSGDLLWAFERGSSSIQSLWDQNVRKLKTRLNIAAYRAGDEAWQLRCLLDVEEPAWFSMGQRELRSLRAELEELGRVLGGTEVESAAATVAAAD